MSIKHILDELVDGITTPQRPSSPIDAYITQEEIFHQNNPGVSSLFCRSFCLILARLDFYIHSRLSI